MTEGGHGSSVRGFVVRGFSPEIQCNEGSFGVGPSVLLRKLPRPACLAVLTTEVGGTSAGSVIDCNLQ